MKADVAYLTVATRNIQVLVNASYTLSGIKWKLIGPSEIS
jgi:hypothetical protein